MKTLLWLALMTQASTHSVVLKWKQGGGTGELTPAYNKVYCGSKSGGPYVLQYKSGAPVATVTKQNVAAGTYYCVVTDVDVQGFESKFSNETKIVVP